MKEPLMAVWWSRVAGDCRDHARALLIGAAARTLGVAAEEVVPDREPGGRPLLAGVARGLHVSLSHCRDAVAVALSPIGPVGVDIEAIRPLPAIALAQRWMSEHEAEWVRQLPPERQVVAFLRLWTYKEAIGKAYGIGLRRRGLRRAVPMDELSRGERLMPIPEDAVMTAANPHVADDLVLAVACDSTAARGVRVTVHEVGG